VSADVTFTDVQAAARVLAGRVHRTPVLRSRRLDEWAGRPVLLKSEHLQRSGAFKARGALAAVLTLPAEESVRGVATHSSGNHGAALALAARERGIPCTVVMPAGATPPKRAAVAGYGATVVECAPSLAARAEALRRVLAQTGAVEVHPYDDPRVIAGAGTAALELLDDLPDLATVVAPVGGGGLAAGTAVAVHGLAAGARVIGAEPAGADDAARSLAAGRRQRLERADTIADGLRTELSDRTFAILAEHLEAIVTVGDDEIVAAMRQTWECTKQVVEPSAAVAIAAVRHLPGQRPVGVIVSGGNADLDALPW
jgi:threonine dehydratase